MYYEDMERMGIDPADIEPKATDNVADMIVHIQGLIAKDMAYAVDGNVYFRVRAFKDYGKLSGQSVEKMEEAVRIEKDAHKQDPLDFVQRG
jgi:cysteinyl-tRNA synthetase